MRGGDPLGVLVAGGRSSRMQTDKSAVRLAGRSLPSWAAAVLARVAVECIQVGGDPIAGLDWSRIPDLRSECGPAAGIEAGLATAHAMQPVPRPIAVLAIDVPFIPEELLRCALGEISRGAAIAAPRWRDRWHPLCGAYGPAALPPLQARLDAGNYDLQGFLAEWATPIGARTLRSYGDPDDFLMNVNTPDDLLRAGEILRAEESARPGFTPPSSTRKVDGDA